VLAPDATLRVRLLDVLTNEPAKVLAEHTMRVSGTVPFRFELPFNSRRIDPSHTYAVDARLTSGTRELHNTEQYAVLTNGALATVNLVLR
jgi:putative lipoprotein